MSHLAGGQVVTSEELWQEGLEMPMEPASSPSPQSPAEAGDPVLRDQETLAGTRGRNIWLCLWCCCVQCANLHRAKPSRAGRPGNPDGLTRCRCNAVFSWSWVSVTWNQKLLKAETHFQSGACKEIW